MGVLSVLVVLVIKRLSAFSEDVWKTAAAVVALPFSVCAHPIQRSASCATGSRISVAWCLVCACGCPSCRVLISPSTSRRVFGGFFGWRWFVMLEQRGDCGLATTELVTRFTFELLKRRTGKHKQT